MESVDLSQSHESSQRQGSEKNDRVASDDATISTSGPTERKKGNSETEDARHGVPTKYRITNSKGDVLVLGTWVNPEHLLPELLEDRQNFQT